jgi:hypothetical protein
MIPVAGRSEILGTNPSGPCLDYHVREGPISLR